MTEHTMTNGSLLTMLPDGGATIGSKHSITELSAADVAAIVLATIDSPGANRGEGAGTPASGCQPNPPGSLLGVEESGGVFAEDRSEPPPGYSVWDGDERPFLWFCRADGLSAERSSRPDAVAACWGHRYAVMAGAQLERLRGMPPGHVEPEVFDLRGRGAPPYVGHVEPAAALLDDLCEWLCHVDASGGMSELTAGGAGLVAAIRARYDGCGLLGNVEPELSHCTACDKPTRFGTQQTCQVCEAMRLVDAPPEWLVELEKFAPGRGPIGPWVLATVKEALTRPSTDWLYANAPHARLRAAAERIRELEDELARRPIELKYGVEARGHLRACEHCKGPGPCLWANEGRRAGTYCCKGCHPFPSDLFFADEAGPVPDVQTAVGPEAVDEVLSYEAGRSAMAREAVAFLNAATHEEEVCPICGPGCVLGTSCEYCHNWHCSCAAAKPKDPEAMDALIRESSVLEDKTMPLKVWEDDSHLVACCIASCGASGARLPRWSHIGRTFGINSGNSAKLARRHGFDPNELVGVDDTEDAVQ